MFNGTWEAGVTISLDLWNWGRTQVRVREAQAGVSELEEQLSDARSAVEMEVRALALELGRAREAVYVLDEGLEEARELYRVVGERFEKGAALNAEVLDAELALRTAETAHVQALVAFAIARVDLFRAVGTLTNP